MEIAAGICRTCRDSVNSGHKNELQPCDECGGGIVSTPTPSCPSCLTPAPWPLGAPLIEMDSAILVGCTECGVDFRCLPYLVGLLLCQPYIDPDSVESGA